jgi:ABC-type multidrug transport system ATPase subunit
VRASIAAVSAAGWLAFDAQLSVARNLLYWARLYGLTSTTAEQRVRSALQVVGLAEWYDQNPGKLSSGMRQRLAIAKGLLFRAPIFILDEPTANIDPAGAYQIRDFIKNTLNRKLGQTVVLTTHNMLEAEELCDRVSIIDRGAVVACDSPARLIAALRGRVWELHDGNTAEVRVALDAAGCALAVRERRDERGTVTLRVLLDDSIESSTFSVLVRGASPQTELDGVSANLEDVFLARTGRPLDATI